MVVQPVPVRLAAGVKRDFADVGDETVDLLVDRAAGAVVRAGGEVLDEVEEVRRQVVRHPPAGEPHGQQHEEVGDAEEDDEEVEVVDDPLHGEMIACGCGECARCGPSERDDLPRGKSEIRSTKSETNSKQK